MSLARKLAEHIVGSDYEDLPPEAVRWSRVGVLDTIGVTLAGSREAAPLIVEKTLDLSGSDGPSLIFGTWKRTRCLDAALVNATSAHALDFDNATNTMFGHASATIIPALLAAGEDFGASGREVLLAHVIGFETGARIGKGVNLYHYEKGWHPSSTLGVFAVAAACARLLHLSVTETETALALSASLAAGIKANFGTMTKPLHVGQCARNGLTAVLLARKGFTANPDALEHKQGFLNVFNGPGHYDLGQILNGWGAPFDIVTPGACYKQYPCCASTHSAIDAALRLVERHGPFEAHKLERVDSWTAATRLAHTNRPHPDSSLDAKFSVQYCVARALLHGKVVFEHFEDDAYRDAAVRELLPRIHAMACTDRQFPPENLLGAEVRVTLCDGRAFSAKLDRPIGRTSANPITADQMMSKFESCASRVIRPGNARSLYRLIESFEDIASVREFTGLLESASSSRGDRERIWEQGST